MARLQRPIRSFVRRAGRQTRAQERALRELWPRFGIPAPADVASPLLDLEAEVYLPGVGHCLLAIERLGLSNVRLLMDDAVEVLRSRLADRSLAGVHLYFPDPWQKKRHHKRRLVQPDFVALLAARLEPRGYVHVATDWPDYAQHIGAVFAASSAFGPAETAVNRPTTRFESRGERLGHAIWEATYIRKD